LRGSLQLKPDEHFASITDPVQLGQMLRALDSYQGSITVRCALELAPLVFVRPSELRSAKWSEIDFEQCQWRIPA
jgi:integrase